MFRLKIWNKNASQFDYNEQKDGMYGITYRNTDSSIKDIKTNLFEFISKKLKNATSIKIG